MAPPAKRTGAIRGWTSVGGAAAALGPVLGGALVAANWRWVFLVNVPVAAVALFAGVRVLPRAQGADASDNSKRRASASADTTRPDTLGAAMFTLAIGVLALALVKPTPGAGDPRGSSG